MVVHKGLNSEKKCNIGKYFQKLYLGKLHGFYHDLTEITKILIQKFLHYFSMFLANKTVKKYNEIYVFNLNTKNAIC